MKLLVISDTHGRGSRIGQVLSLHPRYDMLLFLGDGLRDVDSNIGGVVAVRGNCDSFSLFGDSRSVATERMIDADGVKILMMHGHEKGVKSGIERAAAYAAERGADVLAYGHTHIPEEKYYPAGTELCGKVLEKPLYVFNPGSLGEPRGAKPSFGVIEIKKGQILLSHGYLG